MLNNNFKMLKCQNKSYPQVHRHDNHWRFWLLSIFKLYRI